jgi:hypothetical protein
MNRNRRHPDEVASGAKAADNLATSASATVSMRCTSSNV